jgi:hypothetical protein
MERKGISDMAGEATRVAVRELGKRAKTMERLGGAIPQLRDCEVTASDIGSERVSIKNLPRGRNRGIIGSLACLGSLNSHAEGQRKEGPPHRRPIFVLSSFFSVFARRDTGEQHDPRGRLSGSILTQGRLERQFSVSDLG